MLPHRRQSGRIDFHIHSRASNVTDYYATNALAVPESYSDPLEAYRTLKSRGMKLFTLTDHNSIDGVREMLDAGLEDVFISAEMTATFPEDGCNIHVTVANMTERQFAEVDRLRSNVYEMVDYLDREIACEGVADAGNRIAYFMTHPLMSTQNRPYGREGSLALHHIEKAILLFSCFEVRNGTRTRSLNTVTSHLLTSLSRETIERLANRHDLMPKGPTPWLKGQVGGSDDHSGLNQGRTWTEFPFEGERPTPNDLIDAVRRRQTRAAGAHGGPVTLAHALVKLIHDGRNARPADRPKTSLSIGGPVSMLLGLAFSKDGDSFARRLGIKSRIVLERFVTRRIDRVLRRDASFEKVFYAEVCGMLGDATFRDALASKETIDEKIFHQINTLVNRVLVRYVHRVREARRRSVICIVKELMALVSSNLFLSLPYVIAYSHQSTDRLLLADVRRSFSLAEHQRLALITDTFLEINGVARTIRRMMREADHRDIDLTVIICLSPAEIDEAMRDAEVARFVAERRLKIFPSILDFELPEYRGLKLRVPPFLELLRHAQEEGYTKLQISTPGPVGVAGLLAAKILQIETAATYHTSFPEYVENYTRDVSLEALTWKYMVSFYQSVDEVVVPSRFIARLLHARGLRKRKLLVLDRWVDTERFAPAKRDESFWSSYDVPAGSRACKFVYVGRVGREKNLHILSQAFRRLVAAENDVRLLVIGDGPYRAEMQRELEGMPATFTGFLEGRDLETALASADVKVFPSTTDTWGNAPLEAQACGLPVIVTDVGGPCELMVDGVSGMIVRGGDVHALERAMTMLLDSDLRTSMGEAARRFCVENAIERPYSAILEASRYRDQKKGVLSGRGRSPDEDPHEEEAGIEVHGETDRRHRRTDRETSR